GRREGLTPGPDRLERGGREAASCFGGYDRAMTGRLLAPVLAVAFLALAPLAAGSGQALGATGTISGSGGSYTLTLKNTGDETINCLSLFAPTGVMVTTASGPPQTLRFSD